MGLRPIVTAVQIQVQLFLGLILAQRLNGESFSLEKLTGITVNIEIFSSKNLVQNQSEQKLTGLLNRCKKLASGMENYFSRIRPHHSRSWPVPGLTAPKLRTADSWQGYVCRQT